MVSWAIQQEETGVGRATIWGCGAIALWSFLAVLTRFAAAIPPLQLTAMVFAVAALFGGAILAALGRLGELHQPPLVWAHGVGGLFGYHALYFMALSLAPAAQANLLNYAWPLLIVLFSAALPGMRLGLNHLGGVVLAAAGAVLLMGGAEGFQLAALPGYACALGCAVVWAGYSVLARLLARVPTGAVAGFCAATAVLAALVHLGTETTVIPSAREWGLVALMGIGPTGAAFFLWDYGMKRGDPRLLGTLAYATPITSTLLLCAAGQATASLRLLGAAALVATGGLVAALRRR